MNNYKCKIAYCGTYFSGSQIQPGKRTVEKVLNDSLSKIFKSKIKCQFSGRTDAGVHAEGQFINFKHKLLIPLEGLKKCLNNELPEDLNIISIELADFNFNARFSADSREYRYYISNQYPGTCFKQYVLHTKFNPTEDQIDEFENLFIGKHDFKFFRNTGSNESNTVREIIEFKINKRSIKNWYPGTTSLCTIFEIKIVANAFLYRMVRHIIGCLIEFCNGLVSSDEIKKQFKLEQKILKYKIAPAYGLTLVNVCY